MVADQHTPAGGSFQPAPMCALHERGGHREEEALIETELRFAGHVAGAIRSVPVGDHVSVGLDAIAFWRLDALTSSKFCVIMES